MMQDYQKIFLEHLEKLELEISSLYKLFAQKFPTHKQLWEQMSNEEISHASHIKKLSSLTEEGKVFFDERKTKTYTIKTVSDAVKSTYQKVESGQLTLLNALVYSINLEDSIIESKFYDYFSTSNHNINATINKIKQETREHAQKMKKALEEEKKRR